MRSVLVTHQLYPRAPWPLSVLAKSKVSDFAKNFDEIWVPDHETSPGFSGELSHPTSDERIRYIGPLSRFSEPAITPDSFENEMLVILSGPEPERTRLQQTLVRVLNELNVPSSILTGQPEFGLSMTDGCVKLIPNLNDAGFAHQVAASRHIICRSGYSTLMDLIALQRKALLVPTPGQTEQEYLADHFSEHYGFTRVLQEEITTERISAFLQ
jgi:predicted glycosyltransferase